jgi:hypothetical protein
MKDEAAANEGASEEPQGNPVWNTYYRYGYNVCWTIGTAIFILGLPLFVACRM